MTNMIQCQCITHSQIIAQNLSPMYWNSFFQPYVIPIDAQYITYSIYRYDSTSHPNRSQQWQCGCSCVLRFRDDSICSYPIPKREERNGVIKSRKKFTIYFYKEYFPTYITTTPCTAETGDKPKLIDLNCVWCGVGIYLHSSFRGEV